MAKTDNFDSLLQTYENEFEAQARQADATFAKIVVTSINMIVARNDFSRVNKTYAFFAKLDGAKRVKDNVQKFERALCVLSSDWKEYFYLPATARITIETDSGAKLVTCKDRKALGQIWKDRQVTHENFYTMLMLQEYKEKKEKTLDSIEQTIKRLQTAYKNAGTTQGKNALADALRALGGDIPTK